MAMRFNSNFEITSREEQHFYVAIRFYLRTDTEKIRHNNESKKKSTENRPEEKCQLGLMIDDELGPTFFATINFCFTGPLL